MDAGCLGPSPLGVCAPVSHCVIATSDLHGISEEQKKTREVRVTLHWAQNEGKDVL